MKTVLALLVVAVIIAAPLAWAACSAITYYDTCRWVVTVCYQGFGWCDGEWICDTVADDIDVLGSEYSDGSMLFREKAFNATGQLISCRRYCTCEATCQALNGFNNNSLPCPAQ